MRYPAASRLGIPVGGQAVGPAAGARLRSATAAEVTPRSPAALRAALGTEVGEPVRLPLARDDGEPFAAVPVAAAGPR
jgi:hypothetical protein